MKKELQPDDQAAVRIFDAQTMRRAIRRIAHEIIEHNRNLATLVLAGIPARGTELARRLAADIETIEKIPIETGIIDVSMHRDDLRKRGALPVVRASQLPLPLDHRTVVIVDDVLFTGRTCRAAMDAVGSFGRPACIQFAVLIDRGHRELPIRPDYVGKNLPTSRTERVRVHLQETDHETDGVWLEKDVNGIRTP
jgi:pyrimidine operon attenuation protein/uracil phosphoribosyltransferase